MIRQLLDIQPILTSHGVGRKRVLLAKEETATGINQIAITDLRAEEVAAAHVHSADMLS